MRSLVRETTLTSKAFVYPMFAAEDIDSAQEIGAMPGQARHPVEGLAKATERALEVGVTAVLLFGIPSRKDPRGSQAWSADGISQQAIRALKRAHGEDLLVMADLCLCEYTDHGHCGVLDGDEVDNDETLDLYQRIAVAQAEAGVDVIAPSGMMDGQVDSIRSALDESGHGHIPILAYAAKYASAFYGPFREAAGSIPRAGDRRGYQMDPPNAREALAEMEQDLDEGADMLMVKPALAYLDVVSRARDRFDVPIAAYNVSAEYSMVKAAAAQGWIDERAIVLEILTSIKRAGADLILTYHALDAAGWLS